MEEVAIGVASDLGSNAATHGGAGAEKGTGARGNGGARVSE